MIFLAHTDTRIRSGREGNVSLKITQYRSLEPVTGPPADEVGRLSSRQRPADNDAPEQGFCPDFGELVGNSLLLRAVLHRVKLVAATDTTVLIQGETGTGKELIARAIHQHGKRSHRALIKVDCAAISANLIESELFGHVKGAFTGAVEKRIGRFELAAGGTLFLDEVGELPLECQSRLLRVLQERQFESVGGNRTIAANVRIVAATNRDLKQALRAGRFRADLYYRLNVFPLQLPPLRQRRDDIPLLARHFLRRLSDRLGKPLYDVGPHALARLQKYSWPGNIRELENVIERAAILSPGPIVDIEDDFAELPLELPTAALLAGTLEEVERDYIVQVLDATAWKIEGANGAAAILGLRPSTLRYRMKKLAIARPYSGR